MSYFSVIFFFGLCACDAFTDADAHLSRTVVVYFELNRCIADDWNSQNEFSTLVCSGNPSSVPTARFLQLQFVDFSIDTSVQNRFFAVSDTVLVARAFCSGHAAAVDASGHCTCEHNTAGMMCEACLPLFNRKPWLAATGVDANPCLACTCSGNADVCEYVSPLFT